MSNEYPIRMKYFLIPCLLSLLALPAICQTPFRAYKAPEFARNWSKPGPHPDHIVLNFSDDPATTMSVTWRTDSTVGEAYAEIAPATAAPKFWRYAITEKARTEAMDASEVWMAKLVSHYHSVTFRDLEPNTLYAYRVGDGRIWSEWIQFKTASAEPATFSFLYVGDAQNYILELWSRLIREGYRKAPDAAFIIHAGDLINSAHSEREWHEWFMAGGFIHRMLPSIPLPGNHEYDPYNIVEDSLGIQHLSVQWNPQFTLPDNGPDSLKETAYYVDYQGTRFVALNSNERQEEQVAWLRGVLEDNPNRWTVLTFHHPIFSASARRNNERLRDLWKPLIDEYGVDLVLQGHDHSYARGHTAPLGENVVSGVNARDVTGTMYVVSVSGGKMYDLRPEAWTGWEAERDRAAENTQLFQLIHIDGDTLRYEAYTATGDLYDAFDLIKPGDRGPNRFVERKEEAIPPRRHDNTIPYRDQLPDEIRADLLTKYEDYTIRNIRYVDEPDFQGYAVELRKGTEAVNIRITLGGEVIQDR